VEYTRSVGDCFEIFEGKPEEIAALIAILDKEKKTQKIKIPQIKLPKLQHIKPNTIAKGGVLKGGEK
jgi:hypothetical protein